MISLDIPISSSVDVYIPHFAFPYFQTVLKPRAWTWEELAALKAKVWQEVKSYLTLCHTYQLNGPQAFSISQSYFSPKIIFEEKNYIPLKSSGFTNELNSHTFK